MPDSEGTSLTRRPLTSGVQSEINYRNVNKKTTSGKIRYNAYVKITSTNGGSLPLQNNTYDTLYANNAGKPDATLNSVKIEEAGELGSLIQVHVQFTCLQKSYFNKLEKEFLRLKNQTGENNYVTVTGGYVNRPSAEGSNANKFSLSKMMIYSFGYSFNEQNQWVCNFSAMGSGVLSPETDINSGDKMLKLGLEYKYQFTTSPVITIPQYIKWVGQGGGETRNIELPDTLTVTWDGILNAIWVQSAPGAWQPNSMVGKEVYKLLQRIGIVNEDEMKLFYVRLDALFEMINKFIMYKTETKYVCNDVVTKGGYLFPICSADPKNFLIPGAGNGSGWINPDGDEEDNINCDTEGANYPKLARLGGNTAFYNRMLISYSYLASTMFGQAVKAASENENSAEQTEEAGITSTSLDPTINQLFKDISYATGGAVQLSTHTPSNNQDIIEIVCINEPDASKPIAPARFSPLKSDGMTRKCSVTCNPPKADAWAVAAGTSTIQGTTVDATCSDELPDNGKSAERAKLSTQIQKYRDEDMARNDFSSETVDALRNVQRAFIDNQTLKVATESLPTDLTQWPLNLQIQMDGIHGFKFGNLITSDYLPGQFGKGGRISPAFTVIKVHHKFENNDWETKLDTKCTLVNISRNRS